MRGDVKRGEEERGRGKVMRGEERGRERRGGYISQFKNVTRKRTKPCSKRDRKNISYARKSINFHKTRKITVTP